MGLFSGRNSFFYDFCSRPLTSCYVVFGQLYPIQCRCRFFGPKPGLVKRDPMQHKNERQMNPSCQREALIQIVVIHDLLSPTDKLKRLTSWIWTEIKQEAVQRHCGCHVPPIQRLENMTLWRMEMLTSPSPKTVQHMPASLPLKGDSLCAIC